MVAVSIDGVVVAPERAQVSVFDRGFLYGDGCFEVLRTWGGVARDLDAHLDRLLATAAWLQLATRPRGELAAAVAGTLAAAGPGEHRVRIALTRGPGPVAARLAALPAGVAIVIVEPLGALPAELSACVVDWPIARPGRGHKTLAYLDHVIAGELARAHGADEAIRLDAAGRVVEGATCNLFAVIAGAVVTPPTDAGALPGIVRARVLALCGAAGVATEVRPIAVTELRSADEVFVTSAVRGVVPVTRLDGAARVAGPVTEQLAAAYTAAMRGPPTAF
jgi:branched-chain amino acid aminotransferase